MTGLWWGKGEKQMQVSFVSCAGFVGCVLLRRCELQHVSSFCPGAADGACRELKNGMRGETHRQPPRRHAIAHFLDPMLAVQIYQVDGEFHKKGMNRLTGNDPQAFARSQTLASQQALIALWSAVSDFQVGRQNSAARDVRNPEASIRSWLLA